MRQNIVEIPNSSNEKIKYFSCDILQRKILTQCTYHRHVTCSRSDGEKKVNKKTQTRTRMKLKQLISNQSSLKLVVKFCQLNNNAKTCDMNFISTKRAVARS